MSYKHGRLTKKQIQSTYFHATYAEIARIDGIRAALWVIWWRLSRRFYGEEVRVIGWPDGTLAYGIVERGDPPLDAREALYAYKCVTSPCDCCTKGGV